MNKCKILGTHGSTFGGNALGSRVAMEALAVMEDENFTENSERVGKVVRERLNAMVGNVVQNARGKGLMNAVDINTGKHYLKYYQSYKSRRSVSLYIYFRGY